MALQQTVESYLEVQLLGCDSAMSSYVFLMDELDGKYGVWAVNGRCFFDTVSQQSAQIAESQARRRTKRMRLALSSSRRCGTGARSAAVPAGNGQSFYRFSGYRVAELVVSPV